MLLHQRQIVGAPAGDPALQAERVLVAGLAQMPRGTPRGRAVGADGEQDLAFLLVDRVLALLHAVERDVARVDDVARLVLFGLAHVDDERALVDEPHGVGGGHVSRALAAQPKLVERHGRPRDEEPCDEPNVVTCEFDELTHGCKKPYCAGQYSSAGPRAPAAGPSKWRPEC